MSCDKEITMKTLEEMEKSLGGRFKNGTECPFVLQLYRLASADTLRPPDANEPSHVQPVREHIKKCAVCSFSYHSALRSTLREILQDVPEWERALADEPVGSDVADQEPFKVRPGSLLAEFE